LATAAQRCLRLGLIGVCAVATSLPAQAADPAVVFMAQVGRELMAAARTRSPSAMAAAIERHGDLTQIGLHALGEYRARLPPSERPSYFSGMAKWMGRFAASEAPNYPIARVEWVNESMRGSYGSIMVDSRVVLANGSSYDVRWVLRKYGATYKVADAMLLGFSMTTQLRSLFEDYISKNGGNPRALAAALNR
jgi:phospholipid transport system substrate-binding protein